MGRPLPPIIRLIPREIMQCKLSCVVFKLWQRFHLTIDTHIYQTWLRMLSSCDCLKWCSILATLIIDPALGRVVGSNRTPFLVDLLHRASFNFILKHSITKVLWCQRTHLPSALLTPRRLSLLTWTLVILACYFSQYFKVQCHSVTQYEIIFLSFWMEK